MDQWMASLMHWGKEEAWRIHLRGIQQTSPSH